jgi:hypothetical protein
MLNWDEGYNWTKDQFLRVVNQSKKNGNKWVSLDTEHSDWQNEINMVAWAKELGYEAERKNESVLITF